MTAPQVFEGQVPSLRALGKGLEAHREVGFPSGSRAHAQSPRSQATERLHSETCKMSGFKLPVLRMRKLRPREVEWQGVAICLISLVRKKTLASFPLWLVEGVTWVPFSSGNKKVGREARKT